MMKRLIGTFLVLISLAFSVFSQKIVVPVGGNSFLSTESRAGTETINAEGWRFWSEPDAVFSTFVHLSKPGNLVITAVFDVPKGESRIRCTIGGIAKTVAISGSGRETRLGEWSIKQAGYVRIDIRGVTRTGPVFANVSNLVLSGSAAAAGANFVRDNKENYFYWGRRGPSVHLNFETSPADGDLEYYYSEITVPKGNDIVGSYFMANGFREGYFGFQVNSPSERKILFSVWSPFETDDPTSIPAAKKIRLVKKGKDVVTGEFGNEGSGGQSFLLYNWSAGETYGFLLRGAPTANNYTNFTAWFYSPRENRWRLIATLSRPATRTYLQGLNSFLENFVPETGHITRKAFYHNQWARTKGGKWRSLRRASFTFDETARKNFRLDYRGGIENGGFFLQNGGFFDGNTEYQTVFTRPENTEPPQIDLSMLNQ